MNKLEKFIKESNLIEGIVRPPTKKEIEAHENLLDEKEVFVANIYTFVSAIQPGAVLRDRPGRNVVVGNHCPPPGGPQVVRGLVNLLDQVNSNPPLSAYYTHIEYEMLHPFTDGNGRSGRALWLWQTRDFSLSFLHRFYYETLSRAQF